ncbi:MAG: DUF72 domain-containing protein [Thermoanaerobaculia bacterium]
MAGPENSPTIRVGPAGWSYKDWEGVVYPAGAGSRFDRLAFLAHYFDTIEVNSSFYRVPPPTHATSWVRRTAGNPAFRFTAKLYRGFTHDERPEPGDAAAFRRFLDPLADAGRLGAVLVQFPWSFRNTPEALERIDTLASTFRDYPLAVEVRHASFDDDAFRAFCDEHSLATVNVDQPLFSDSIAPAAVATGPLGYVRFHGRNYQKWFAHEESWERYDYLYAPEELEPWVRRIRELAGSGDVYAITNNHFRGQAIVNAVELRGALGQEGEVPPPLLDAYPDRFRGSARSAGNLLAEQERES